MEGQEGLRARPIPVGRSLFTDLTILAWAFYMSVDDARITHLRLESRILLSVLVSKDSFGL